MSDETEIRELVIAFITEMNAWELECRVNRRKEKKGQLSMEETGEINLNSLRTVYQLHCQSWDNPKRGVTWGDPPTYDPENSTIQSVEINRTDAVVNILHTSDIFKDGITQYFVHKIGGEWKLEDRCRNMDLEGNIVQKWNTL